jgi:uncharacterized membrane protein
MKSNTKPSRFFSREEQQRLIAAITEAENKTSGEIRVHLERKATGDPYEEAKILFERLGMTKTGLRNGVLIYMTLSDNNLVILGDKAINQKVTEKFWDDVLKTMLAKFQKDHFIEGLENGIALIGDKLLQFFPLTTNDINELSNEISTGD